MIAELGPMRDLTDPQRVLYQAELRVVRKDGTLGVFLAVFLGGLGAHHFYLGSVGLGVLYLVFSWTFLPSVIGVIEAFFMPERVREYNLEQAKEIARTIKSVAPAPA